MSDLGTILDLAQKITITAGLLLVILGGIKKQWVWGWLYDQMVAAYEARIAALTASYEVRLQASDKDRDEWKQRALDQLGINKDTADSLKKLVAQASRPQTDVAGTGAAKGGPTP